MPELASPRIVLSSPFRRARADASSRFHNFNSHRNQHRLETKERKRRKRRELRGKTREEGGEGGGEKRLEKISGGTLTRRRWTAGGAWRRDSREETRWWPRGYAIENELDDSNDTRCIVREVGSRGHASLSVSRGS